MRRTRPALAGMHRPARLCATLAAALAVLGLTASATAAITGILPGGPPVRVEIAVAGDTATATFDGTAGQRVSLEITDVTIGTSACCGAKVSFLRPDGRVLTSLTVGTNGGFIDATALPTDGEYSIVVDPTSTNTGGATVTLYAVPPDITGGIAADGPPVVVDLSAPGRNARLAFAGTAGERVSVEIGSSSIGPSVCCGAKISLVKPDGKTLASSSFGTNGGFLDATTLASSGTYTLLVDPQGASTGSATVTLHDVPADATATIVPGGPPVTVTTTVPGQNAELTFSGIAGQRIALELTDVCCTTKVTIVRPDGKTLATASAGSFGGFIDATSLPLTGVYTIQADTQGAATGSVTYSLYDVPADATGTIAPGGPPVTLSTSVPGQNARLTFAGTTGLRVSLSIGPTCCATRITILKPNGATLVGPVTTSSSGGFVDTTSLSTTGTYTILVDPQAAATGTMTVTLYDVPADATGTVAPGGPSATVTSTVPGQNARLTFDSTGNERVSLRVGPTCCSVRVSILKPSGSTMASVNAGTSGGFLDVTTLPVSGTYAIVVDPQGAATGSVTLTLYDVPANVSATITPGGAPLTVTMGTPGQNAEVTFTGVANQRVSLAVSASCCTAAVTIVKPDGSTLASTTSFGAVGFLDTQRLPASGTYTIVVDPQGPATGSMTLTLYDVPADVAGTLVPDGAPVTVSIGTPGQNARVGFDGTAGQRVSLEITNVSIGSTVTGTRVSILRPDGMELTTPVLVGTNGGSIDPVSLPVTGTYTVLVDPQGANTGSATLTLHDVPADVTATVVPGGASVTVTTTTPGQNALVTFTGTAGRRVSLELRNASFGSSTCCGARVSILEPGGAALVAPSSFGTSGGFVDAVALPADGTYTILVDPQGTATGSVTLTLYDVPADATAAATPGGAAATVTTTTPGQNGAVTFAGTVGQRVSVKVGPTCCIAAFRVLGPGGSVLFGPTSFGTGGGFIDTLPLLASGTYTIEVNPSGPAVGNVTMTVYDVPPDVAGTIATGSSTSVTTSVPGQNAQVTFDGASDVGVKLTVGPFNCCSTRITMMNPDGTTLTGPTSFNPDGGTLLARLGVAGAYTIVVDPQGAATGVVNLALELDTTAPAPPTLTLSESAPDSHVIGSTFYYRPAGTGGTFVVGATSADAGAGLQKVRFPGLGSGFSPGSAVDDTLSPYSQTYTWTPGATFQNPANLVTAYDRVGNTSSTPFAVVSDSTPPTTTDNTAAIGSSWKNATQLVNLSPLDGAGSGSAITYYTSDGSTPTTASPQGTTVSLSAEGVYTVRYFSVDSVGNVEGVQTAGTQIRLDLTKPTSAVLDALPATIKSGQVLTGSGADALSGLASVAYYYCAGTSCTPSILIASSSAGPTYPVTWTTQPADGTYQLVARAVDAAGNTLDSAKQTVTIDNTAPNTTVTSGPVNPTNQTSATFAFTSTEAGSTFQCSLDGAAFASCSSPRSYSGFAEGAHTFQVRATDPVGNTDGTPASFGWSVDLTSPDTAIIAAPTSPANSTSASFSFSSTEGGSSFQCSLDGAAFASCASPKSYSGLAEGAHTFQVRATDPAGNTDATPASYGWTIDTTAPDTTITAAPASPTNATSASISFSATESGSTFQCRLDGASFIACTSPKTYTGLTAGAHTFDVRAVDPAGNTDPTPASITWTVDTTAPDTTVTSGPTTPTNQTAATFAFTSSEVGSTFACSLDGAAFATCTTSTSYSGLAEGAHTFQVRATDPAGNVDVTPASFGWTIDTTAPDTTITAAPASPTNATSASISFSSTEGGSTFQCRLDGAAYASCTSPKTYPALAEGSHTFQVRATDPAGNTDATPASYGWTIDTTAPDTTITSAPANPTNETTASFAFSSEPGLTFACNLDGSGYAPCTSPTMYTGLSAGSHSFQVRATDVAGNTDPTSAAYTWTVDLTAPETMISSGPAAQTNQTTASLDFSASESGATFACSLDGSAFAACTSPETYTGLVEGAHMFEIRATDAAGNTDNTPAARSWTVDTTPPAAPLISVPADGSVGNSTSITLSGSAEPGTTVQVFEGLSSKGSTTATAAGAWARTLTGVADGSHTYTARATDPAGNTSAQSNAVTVVVDTAAPNTTVTTGPLGSTAATSASFTFSADDPSATFECRVDGAAFASCTSPKTYSALSEGAHTFEVRATDAAGNTDPTPATRTWTVDVTAPAAPVITAPADGTLSTSSGITVSGSAESGTIFVEVFDGSASKGTASVGGGGAWSKAFAGVADGSHTYTARATDAAGNTSPPSNSVTIVVDTTAPDTAITAGPAGLTGATSATFEFSATEAGSFQCRLDGGLFSPCASPETITGLSEGAHTFEVRAVDAAGNPDPTPATRPWTVDTVAPETTISSGPADPTSATDATFDFASSESGSAFECSLDGEPFIGCSPPHVISGLTAGSHTFEVRATDVAENTDATPAAYTWTVA